MIDPPVWSDEQLEEGRQKAIANFRRERLEEPLEAYLEAFDEYQGVVEDLLESTVDLRQLDENALAILTNDKSLETFRYLSGPPISADDLKVLADAVLTAKRLRADPDMVRRIVQVVLDVLDRRRFPWVTEGREPSEAERAAAVIASTALIAMRRTETLRRKDVKELQEQSVEGVLSGAGFKQVAARTVEVLEEGPGAGEFCRESKLGTRKADFIIRLYDKRVMPVECKVSNSATNSVKRLNNDAAVKAVSWRNDFGVRQVVPAAVLSGVYKLGNLKEAQNRGLALFWAHELSTLIKWIESTKR